MARRAVAAGLTGVLALCLSFPAPVRAQDQPVPERQDRVMGAGSGAVTTGRDPVTGDTVLKATPQEQPREQYPAPSITVQPEITLPAGRAKKPAAGQ